MLTLLGVGFLGGLITGVSPCVLPVVPVIAAGGSAGAGRWRPYVIIAALVATFSLATLAGGALLSLLGLPQDLLRDLGIALLIVLGLGLVVPKLGELLERPFARLGRGRPAVSSNAVVLGASLGLVFAPCAGPVLAAISVVASTRRVGFSAVLLTLAYAVGAALPLLGVALLARRAADRLGVVRNHAPAVRVVAGALLLATALAIAYGLTTPLQTSVPGYASALENRVEGSPAVTRQLQALTGEHANRFSRAQQAARRQVAAGALPDLGPAPGFAGITTWLNTGGRPLTLAGLRGKVVLVDFWTYSCINCLRSLPHVEAWYRTYHDQGLVVVGVHTPEFPFEHVVGNVTAAVHQLGVTYPVAVDDDYGTWNAYNNEYWPAEYLIDQDGHVRHTSFGEGDYGATERSIRTLLAAGGAMHLAPPTGVADRTPSASDIGTPETYLGFERLQNYDGTAMRIGLPGRYHFPPALPANEFSLSGGWTVKAWDAVAGGDARMELAYTARDVYLVLGGSGTVAVTVNGHPTTTVAVHGVPNLHTLVSGSAPQTGLLELSFSPGVQAYDFTFG
ncbi:MAG TPA: cytochrome c biogenesis protein DipZ [Acidimicrobiales bacterium]|nr:cytochrome c biogenesis protein DipZ [Acidimicrobiales bacterium]